MTVSHSARSIDYWPILRFPTSTWVSTNVTYLSTLSKIPLVKAQEDTLWAVKFLDKKGERLLSVKFFCRLPWGQGQEVGQRAVCLVSLAVQQPADTTHTTDYRENKTTIVHVQQSDQKKRYKTEFTLSVVTEHWCLVMAVSAAPHYTQI